MSLAPRFLACHLRFSSPRFSQDDAKLACNCGLGRFRAVNIPASLPKVQCAVIDEADPDVNNTIEAIRNVAELGRLHSMFTIIYVPRGLDDQSERYDSEDESPPFQEKIKRLGLNLVSLSLGDVAADDQTSLGAASIICFL